MTARVSVDADALDALLEDASSNLASVISERASGGMEARWRAEHQQLVDALDRRPVYTPEEEAEGRAALAALEAAADRKDAEAASTLPLRDWLDVRVQLRHGFEREVAAVVVSVPDSWLLTAGEYPETPDLIVEVHHAIDSDGTDLSQDVARVIAEAIEQHAADHARSTGAAL